MSIFLYKYAIKLNKYNEIVNKKKPIIKSPTETAILRGIEVIINVPPIESSEKGIIKGEAKKEPEIAIIEKTITKEIIPRGKRNNK